jgi:DNA gyrase subunit B
MAKEYKSENIKVLGVIEGMKSRATLYLDDLGKRGMTKILLEMVQNAVDEAKESESHKIDIIIDTKIPEITVKDYGRGIPFDKIEPILTELHSSGKMDQSSYSIASGTNGLGLKLCNFLSDYLIMIVHKDGKTAKLRFEEGYKKSFTIEDNNSGECGTHLTIKPTQKIFFNPEYGYLFDGQYFDINTIKMIIESLSYIHPNIEINFTVDNKKTVYLFEEGLSSYLKLKMKNDKVIAMTDIFEFNTRNDDKKLSLQAIISFSKQLSREKYASFVNYFPTFDDGKHVDGVRAGISKAITQYIKSHDYIPKGAKYTVTGADVIDNIYGIVMATHPHAVYINQTKSKFLSEDFYTFAANSIYSPFLNWLNHHPSDADNICKLALIKAKANYAAKEARQIALDPSNNKNIFQSKVDLRKFTDCNGNNPQDNELFLLEGDSAGGSAAQARDPKTQALLRLRGKVLNVIGKKTGKLSNELEAIATVIGMGLGEKKNLNKLKFWKIVIMTDADPDGGHITSLLLAFFITYYPELIENGHIYIATPPFYQLILGKTTLNILNEDYFRIYKREIALKTFELLDENKKIVNQNIFKVYLNKIIGYNTFLDNFATELNLNPILLELIIRNFDSLMKGKYKQFEHFGFHVKEKERSKSYIIFDIDKEYNHYYLRLDNTFYESIYKPIYMKLCDIKLSNVLLKSNKSNKIYGGTTYQLSEVIDSTMTGKGAELKRYKGLGEMNPKLLKETAMDPKTRKIYRVTMADATAAMRTTEIYLGKSEMETKKDLFGRQL